MTPLKSSNRRDLNGFGLNFPEEDGLVAAAFCGWPDLGHFRELLGLQGEGTGCGGLWEVCLELNRESSY